MCAGMSAEHAVASGGHVKLVHLAQQADAADPWLQSEWAAVLVALGRGSESGRHYQVTLFLV